MINGIRWNLGDVYVTDGIACLLDAVPDEDYLDSLLRAHFYGNYGMIMDDPSDLSRNIEARKAGRPFTSLFQKGQNVIKIKSVPSLNRTVVCLPGED